MLNFGKKDGWTISESAFDPAFMGKVETCFAQGNGYLGLRAAAEEKYLGETRDLLVAGTYDRFSEEEVTELPNAADFTNIEINLNGQRFDLTQGMILHYSREINLKTGLLKREVMWQSPKGELFALKFERIVSLTRLHTIAFRITIIPEQDAAIKFTSGILKMKYGSRKISVSQNTWPL